MRYVMPVYLGDCRIGPDGQALFDLYRRAKRKAQQRAAADTVSDKDEEDVVNMRPPETESHAQTDSDIEAKLATVKDQKEAKRLKRWGFLI